MHRLSQPVQYYAETETEAEVNRVEAAQTGQLLHHAAGATQRKIPEQSVRRNLQRDRQVGRAAGNDGGEKERNGGKFRRRHGADHRASDSRLEGRRGQEVRSMKGADGDEGGMEGTGGLERSGGVHVCANGTSSPQQHSRSSSVSAPAIPQSDTDDFGMEQRRARDDAEEKAGGGEEGGEILRQGRERESQRSSRQESYHSFPSRASRSAGEDHVREKRQGVSEEEDGAGEERYMALRAEERAGYGRASQQQQQWQTTSRQSHSGSRTFRKSQSVSEDPNAANEARPLSHRASSSKRASQAQPRVSRARSSTSPRPSVRQSHLNSPARPQEFNSTVMTDEGQCQDAAADMPASDAKASSASQPYNRQSTSPGASLVPSSATIAVSAASPRVLTHTQRASSRTSMSPARAGRSSLGHPASPPTSFQPAILDRPSSPHVNSLKRTSSSSPHPRPSQAHPAQRSRLSTLINHGHDNYTQNLHPSLTSRIFRNLEITTSAPGISSTETHTSTEAEAHVEATNVERDSQYPLTPVHLPGPHVSFALSANGGREDCASADPVSMPGGQGATQDGQDVGKELGGIGEQGVNGGENDGKVARRGGDRGREGMTEPFSGQGGSRRMSGPRHVEARYGVIQENSGIAGPGSGRMSINGDVEREEVDISDMRDELGPAGSEEKSGEQQGWKQRSGGQRNNDVGTGIIGAPSLGDATSRNDAESMEGRLAGDWIEREGLDEKCESDLPRERDSARNSISASITPSASAIVHPAVSREEASDDASCVLSSVLDQQAAEVLTTAAGEIQRIFRGHHVRKSGSSGTMIIAAAAVGMEAVGDVVEVDYGQDDIGRVLAADGP